MFNVCPKCGEYHVEKTIQESGTNAQAICPSCNHAHSFKKSPLFLLTGPSGSGKSTVGLHLQQFYDKVVVIESDIFWIKELQDAGDVRHELMLRVCKNISQAGKPVLLVGCNIPEHFQNSIEKRYFSDLHYIALTCTDEVLQERLFARPEWRGFSTDASHQPHLEFNRWFKTHYEKLDASTTLIDNTNLGLEETIKAVKKAIEAEL